MGTTESNLYDASLQQEERGAAGHDIIVDRSHSHGRRATASPSTTGSSPVRRYRQRPRLPENVMIMKGLVLGLTNSGKRTLLQRLEGKDPFAAVPAEQNAQHRGEITVPYQPPPNATVWDRIQLEIQTKPTRCDFCVILVHPQHDPKKLRPFITKIVTMLVQQAGYVQKTTTTTTTTMPPPRPLCLCILLNFRDLQGDRHDCIQLADLEEWTSELLGQHSVLENKVVLQCGTTSLRNCYGLSSLHHFIYRSYLQQKQAEWEQRLEDVRAELDKSRDVPTMTFEAFLKVLNKTVETDSLPEKHNERYDEIFDGASKKGSQKETRKNADHRNDLNVAPQTETKPSMTNDRKIVERKQEELSRSILPKKYVDPKQTLEAFFADDDDDDDVTPKTSRHAHDSDDDDDDDDFFYDEQGQRHQHGHVDSFSDDEEESNDSKSPESLAKARELSIVDEESSDDEPSTSSTEKVSQKPKQVTTTEAAADTADDENEMEIHNDDENGWGDDGIDFDDEDDENEHGGSKLEHAQSAPPDTKKVEDDVNGSSNHEGWKDDDMSDNGKTPNDENSIPVSDQVNKNGTSDGGTLSEPKDSSTDETEQSGSAKDDEHSLVDSEATAADAVRRSIDDKFVHEKEAQVTKPAHATTSSAKIVVSNDSDDDDFVAEETPPKSLPKKAFDKAPLIPREEPSSVASTAPSPSTPGISAAALAAIMAAEREAELMVQEAMNARPEKPAKKPKKKKDPEGTKKKKKKKEKHKDSY